MLMKSLQQIKDEYISENDLVDYGLADGDWMTIAQLYAQECVREAVRIKDEIEMLKNLKGDSLPGKTAGRIAHLEQQLKQLKGEI